MYQLCKFDEKPCAFCGINYGEKHCGKIHSNINKIKDMKSCPKDKEIKCLKNLLKK